MARKITNAPFTAIGTARAVQMGLLDATFGATLGEFQAQTRTLAEKTARDPRLQRWLQRKRARRARDERIKPLESYRNAELTRSHRCFFGGNSSYHDARRRFVYKRPAPAASPEQRELRRAA